MPRKIAPRRVAQLQRRYLREEGASPAEIRRWLPYLTAQIGAESNFTQGVRSPAGAGDIAQFMPGTAPGYGVTLGDDRIKDDIRGQIRYMLPLLRRHGVEGALRAYNAGPGAIEASKGYAETNQYVQRVKATAGRYSAGVGGGGAGETTARYQTIPGVDNTQQRQLLMQQYLLDRGKPNALLELQAGLSGARDVPETRVRVGGGRTGARAGGRSRPGDIYELFYRGPGGINIDNGQRVGRDFVSGHEGHVHLAADKATMRRANRLARRLGLHVGEYGKGITSGHAPNSFHYQPYGAMDVSGDPARMREFNRRVARGDF